MKFTKSLASFTGSAALRIIIRDLYGLPVDDARNELVRQFLATDFGWLMFIDNDASWAPGSIQRMVSHDLPMVCGGMYTKDVPPMPTIGKFMGSTPDGRIRYHYQNYVAWMIEYTREHDIKKLAQNENLFEVPKLKEIDGCGMHFTLIRRDVIEALDEPYFLMQGKTGAGEDFFFCRKVRAVHKKIYTDLSVQTAHCAGEVYDFGLRELLHVNNLILEGSPERELHVG